MDGIAMPVTIIVKAPNQKIEDQTIQCELNWTIKRLKGHLSEVYPNNPRLEDQKLIYSGQLLVDTVQLKDVLRTYEGQENHTVHLVCSPPRDAFKSSTSKTNIKSSTSSSSNSNISNTNSILNNNSSASILNNNSRPSSQTQINTAPIQTSADNRQPGVDPRELWAAAAAYPNVGPFNNNGNAAMSNQMAWMQQAYSQYVSQYMQFLAASQGAVGMNNIAAGTPMYAAAYTNAGVPNVIPQAGHYQNQLNENQQQPPAAVNNQQQQQGDDDEEGRGNRDWLDWFYIMSRVLVLFSIVYFYSSPVRFLMVSTLGMIMYLYQVGFFRMQGLENRAGADAAVNGANQNNAGVAAAAAAPERDNNNERPNLNVPQSAASNASTTATTTQEDDTPQPPPEPERPSFLMLTWTILWSFFVSLIPEQPNVI